MVLDGSGEMGNNGGGALLGNLGGVGIDAGAGRSACCVVGGGRAFVDGMRKYNRGRWVV